ncbi:MAG: hypothetical protein V1663_03965 [archaeon]
MVDTKDLVQTGLELEYITTNERLREVAISKLELMTRKRFPSILSLEQEVQRVLSEKGIKKMRHPAVMMERNLIKRVPFFNNLPYIILSSDLFKDKGKEALDKYWEEDVLKIAEQCENPVLYVVDGSIYFASTV